MPIDPEILEQLQPACLREIDGSHVVRYNKLVEDLARREEDASDFIRRFTLNANLPPIAYDGDPKTARVALLLLNPQYANDATPDNHYQPDPDYPLSVLSPRAKPGTRKHYLGIFQHLLKEFDEQHLSRCVLKVELCPWASKSFPGGALGRRLAQFPSRRLAGRIVDHLAQQGTVLVIMKGAGGKDAWSDCAPSLTQFAQTRAFKNKYPRFNHLNAKAITPEGWEAVCTALRTERAGHLPITT